MIPVLIFSGTAFASMGGDNRDAGACAAWLRNLAEQRAGKTPPKACEDAAEYVYRDSSASPRRETDFTWIDSDISQLTKLCGACAESESKCKKYQRTVNMQKPEKKTICTPDDSLCAYTSCEQALIGLAGDIEAAAEAGRLAPAPEAEAAAAKKNAAAVLARAVFRQKAAKEPPPFIRKIRDQFNRFLKNLIRRLMPKPRQARHRRFGAQLARGIMFAIVVFGLALLLAMGMSRLRWWYRDEPEAERVEKNGGGVPITPGEHVSEAEALCARGEYRAAIRSLFLAFLRKLEQKGLVIYIKNKTNREYLSELRNSNKLNPYMENFTLQYEEAWYGMKACARGDYDRAREAYERSGSGL